MTRHATKIAAYEAPEAAGDAAAVNAMLDLAESALRTLLDLGAGPQVVARVERLLGQSVAVDEPVAAAPAERPAEPITDFELTAILGALKNKRHGTIHTTLNLEARAIVTRELRRRLAQSAHTGDVAA